MCQRRSYSPLCFVAIIISFLLTKEVKEWWAKERNDGFLKNVGATVPVCRQAGVAKKGEAPPRPSGGVD